MEAHVAPAPKRNIREKRKHPFRKPSIRIIVTGEDKDVECLENCICKRDRSLVLCTKCQKTFKGRISERCPSHPEVAYLMDARHCAFCGAAAGYLKLVEPMEE